MKRNIFAFPVVLMLIVAFSTTAFAQKKVAQTGMTFLKIGVGARAAAMGESYTAMAGDVNAVFWNPAGLASIADREVTFSYIDWIADLKHQAVAAAWNLDGIGTFAFSLVSMDYGDPINYTRRTDTEAGFEIGSSFSPTEYVAGFAFARQFTEKFSMGMHLKYAYQGLGLSPTSDGVDNSYKENEVDVVAVDFGTSYMTGIRDLRFAVSLSNFSENLQYEEESFQIPLTFRMGLAMSVWDVEEHSVTVAVDAIHPRDFSEQIHSGIEYWYSDLFALRGGYKFNHDEEGLTFGVGLNYEMLVFDYAYGSFGTIFGSVNRFSLGLKF